MQKQYRDTSGYKHLAGAAALAIGCTVLGGCATDPHSDSAQFRAPTAVSDIYSSVQMQLMLATTSNPAGRCAAGRCEKPLHMDRPEFERQVAQIGARLSAAAYREFPDLTARIPEFHFSVVDKAEPGTASTAGGQIVILSPVISVAPENEALSFVIAREMGHVVAQHHEENTATSIFISVLATVIAPVINVAKLLASVYSGATALAASASVTAASFAGSRVLIESYRPRQRDEADEIAIKLLADAGIDAVAVADSFAGADLSLPDTPWLRALRVSVEKLSNNLAHVVTASARVESPRIPH